MEFVCSTILMVLLLMLAVSFQRNVAIALEVPILSSDVVCRVLVCL